MKNNKIKLMIFAIAITFSMNGVLVRAESTDILKDQINNNNQDINNLQEQKDKVIQDKSSEQDQLKVIDDKISSKNNEIVSNEKNIKEYETKIGEYEGEISSTEQKINDIKSDIAKKESDIKEMEQKQESQKRLLTGRIRSYYKVDVSMQYLGMLLKSKNFFEIFNNMGNVIKIMNVDKKMIGKFKEQQSDIENEKQIIETNLNEQNNLKNSLKVKEDELVKSKEEFVAINAEHEKNLKELQSLHSEKENKIAGLQHKESAISGQIGDLLAYNSDLQGKLDQIFVQIQAQARAKAEEEQKEKEAEQAKVETEKKELAQRQEEEKQQSEKDNGKSQIVTVTQQETVKSEAGFIKPVNGPITDPYGPRNNPVTGAPGMHNGVDFGVNYGAPVYASKSGIIVFSGWIEGYGNTIIIDHGNGVQTLYGHNQTLTRGVGQAVSQGDVVAEAGSTGMSTGPHCHFEVRIGGVA